MLEAKIKFKKGIEQKKSKSEVCTLFNKYEAEYLKMKNPNEKDKKDYVCLYFAYTDYMAKRDK